MRHRISKAEEAGIQATSAPPTKKVPEFTFTPLPDDDVSVDVLVAHRKKQFQHLSAHEKARRLIQVDIKIDGPIGIWHAGDPHCDDDGTDILSLEAHCDLVNKTPGMFAANVGDTTNNWVGRLAHLYGQQSTSAKQAWRLAEWFVTKVDWLYMLGGNHDCHDMETEALTRRGWMRFDDIRQDDEVLSFNAETGGSEWSSISKIVSRHHDGEMVKISTQSVDMVVTPNHRVLCRDRDWKNNWREWKFVQAGALPARVAIPASAKSNGVGVALSNDQISLAGWILTDGSISWAGNSPRVTLYQSKDGSVIQGLLDRLGLAHRYTVRARNIHQVNGRALVATPLPQQEWSLTADASRAVLQWLPQKGTLPSWADDLSAEQFSVLLDALIAGDGCWDGVDHSAKRVCVLHGEHGFLSSVQAVAVRNGWNARISIARGKDARLNLCRRESIQFETAPATKKEHYSGRVWCLTVPLGNFMVRRNGAAHFSGNCWSGAGDPLQWITRQTQAIYQSSEARLELRFPNSATVRVNARHDFAGHSQYNPAHGPTKATLFGVRDHIAIAGHKHVSGYGVIKDPTTGITCHALKVASYKVYDRYAREKGFRDQALSPCVVTVIDPALPTDHPDLVKVFWDPYEGADFLKFKRRKKAA